MNPITISVLFTDIEGSTERWERYPEPMRRALERHDAILRSCFDVPGMRFIKHTGDGMVWASTDPTTIIRSAIAAQVQIADGDWHEVDGLKVRMGAHIGELHERDGDLFGTPMNLTARVMGGASGGQIALTSDLLDRIEVPAPWSAEELGRFRFRGILEPVVVHGLVHPEQPAHPPYRSGAIEVGNLPASHTRLVGRTEALAQLDTAIRSPGIVTIVGSGGVGKTAVALAAGLTAEHVFPDGRWFVDLTTIRAEADVDDIVSHVIATLGLVTQNEESPATVLGRALTSRSMLVVLDNCEHVIAGVREALRQSLWADHRATVVATSREAIRHPAERLITLLPLDTSRSDSEAVQLFVDRVGLVNPGYSPAAGERRDVMRLCQHLDGLPLAIELAASRTATFSVTEIIGLLDRRFRLLQGQGDGRHGALERTIGWSYDLLTVDEQQLLCASTVLDGSFDLEQVAAAASVDTFDGADLITSLIDKSLVTRVGQGTATFRLFESIRAYALARLDDGIGRDLVADRLVKYATDLVRRAAVGINGTDQLEWFDRIDRAMPALRVAVDRLNTTAPVDALELLVRTYPYWIARGNRHEALRWLLGALAAAPDAPVGLSSRAWADASTLAFFCGEPGSLAHGARSIEIAEANDLASRPSALVRLAALHLLDGGVEAALLALEEAIVNLQQSFDPPEPPEVATAVGALVAMAGQGERGVDVCRAAMALHPSPSPTTEVSDLLNLALALRTYDPLQAADVFTAARDRANVTRSPFYAVTAGIAGGMCLRTLGREDEALTMLVEALPLALQLGMHADTLSAVRAIARLLQARSISDGDTLLEQVNAVRRTTHDQAPPDLGPLVDDALEAVRHL